MTASAYFTLKAELGELQFLRARVRPVLMRFAAHDHVAPDIPLGRPGTAEEAARTMLFLASPLAAYISGHTLEVSSS